MAFPRPFGRYVLDERLALGGMAEIFRGRTSTEGFEKKVCIKRILPHFSEQEDFVTMFRDEAALAANLQHANIVQVFDFGSEEETLFLAMEFVDGADLRRLLDGARKKAVSLGTGHAIQIAIEVCRGLHHAHALTDDAGRALGIVHRDISPHNILVSRAGEVKVTDFGIAKASARATHTGTGVVKGKLAYMAPEQANSKPFDQRVDQFATGIVLWEMLTGQRLFSGPDEVTVLRKVMMCEVPPPTSLRDDVPAPLEAIVMKALSESPDDRYADMRQLEHALGRCLFEVTSDPEETNLRPFVEAVLGPPEASRRHTAVLVENPVMQAPGEEVPSLTEAGYSAVFSDSGEHAQNPSIGEALGEDSAPGSAATVMLDGSSSNPVAKVPEEGTGVTRTVVPKDAEAPVTAAPSPPVVEERPEPTAASSAPPMVREPAPTPSRGAEGARGGPPLPALLAGGAVVVLLVLGAALLGTGGSDEEDPDLEVMIAPVAEVAKGATAAEPSAPATETDRALPPEPEPEPKPEPEPEPASAAETAPRRATAAAKTPAEASRDQRRSRPSEPSEKPRPKGRLILEMASGWAHAYLGKTKICETPCTVELAAGPHVLRLVSGDGSERRHRVTVKAGATVRSVVP